MKEEWLRKKKERRFSCTCLYISLAFPNQLILEIQWTKKLQISVRIKDRMELTRCIRRRKLCRFFPRKSPYNSFEPRIFQWRMKSITPGCVLLQWDWSFESFLWFIGMIGCIINGHTQRWFPVRSINRIKGNRRFEEQTYKGNNDHRNKYRGMHLEGRNDQI